MKVEDLLRWPTNSSDPGINFVAIVVIAMLGLAALVFSAMLLIPLAIGFGIFKWVQWHAGRPTPTADIIAVTQQRVFAANFPDTEAFVDAYVRRLADVWKPDLPTYDVLTVMIDIAEGLYDAESLNNPLPPAPPASAIAEGRYRDNLIAHARKCADAPATLAAFSDALSRSLGAFRDALPSIARSTPREFVRAEKGEASPTLATVPVIDLVPNIGQLVWHVAIAFYSEDVNELGLFADLKRQLDLNDQVASQGSRQYVPPYEFKGTPREIVRAYLGNTPLEQLFEAQAPFAFADEQRFEHMHVIGGSGHGKTQLLQHLIYHDLTRDGPPALIIIDSQGDMLRKIERLDLFARPPLADRLIVIDPEDVEFPPSLNMFDMTNARLAGYSLAHREQIEASVIELYNFIFGALAAELTQKQGTAFAYVARLMLAMPGATIHTLRELMEDSTPELERSAFAQHIAKLDTTAQAFFQNQFFSRAFVQTKQQIARRLYGVLQVPAFDRMFSAPTNKLDMFEAIQSGKIVLVNTSKALLKSDASALFGRYMIALAMRAAFERVAVRNHDPAFLIVDEAAEYFDENLETLLSQARKFNMGVLFAHQHLDQLSTGLRSSVAANTSIKLAGGVSDRDARALAPDMRATAEFIASTRKHEHSTEFACYVRNMTDNAVRLSIPFGTLEAAPRMSRKELAAVVERNRAQYCSSSQDAEPAQALEPLPAKGPPSQPGRVDPDSVPTDAADKW